MESRLVIADIFLTALDRSAFWARKPPRSITSYLRTSMGLNVLDEPRGVGGRADGVGEGESDRLWKGQCDE